MVVRTRARHVWRESRVMAVSVAKDMAEGIVDRFRTMRAVSSAVLTGHAVASMARNLVSRAIVVVVALAPGSRSTAGAGARLGVFGMVSLCILSLSWLPVTFGLLARTPDAAASLSFLILLLRYVSSAFVPCPDGRSRSLSASRSRRSSTPLVDSSLSGEVGDSRAVGFDLGPAPAGVCPGYGRGDELR